MRLRLSRGARCVSPNRTVETEKGVNRTPLFTADNSTFSQWKMSCKMLGKMLHPSNILQPSPQPCCCHLANILQDKARQRETVIALFLALLQNVRKMTAAKCFAKCLQDDSNRAGARAAIYLKDVTFCLTFCMTFSIRKMLNCAL